MIYTTHLFRHLRRVIGYNIHRSRVRQQLTLQKLSRLTGLPEGKLDRYELGKGMIPLDDMLKITCALGVNAPDLMREP